MGLDAVMRYELQGLSCGLYRELDEYQNVLGWNVVSTSTGKVMTNIVSVSHGIEILMGCIEEIKSRIGYTA